MKSPIAHTALGDLRGVEHKGLAQFRGVPYAMPPVGEHRFRPPRPVEPWRDTLDATTHGPIAPQHPSRLRAAVGDFSHPQDEDCLTLTITTPAPDDEKRQVIVWLHGGGYGSGAGSLDVYDGVNLAREGDVVVVSVNYRLGPLGYLFHEGLGDGRMGLQDMVEAIRWTAAHIAAFGGDPEKIVLAGQSAGAHSTMAMLATPDVKPLFQRVILASPPAGLPPFSREQAAEWTWRYLKVLELDGLSRARVLDRMRSAEPGRLVEAAGVLARTTAKLGQVAPPFVPVADELAVPDTFLRAAGEGAAEGGVAVMVGTNRDEARAIVAGDPRAEAASRADVDAYLRSRVDAETAGRYWQRRSDGRPVDVLADAMTELSFRRPSLDFAEHASRAGADVWTYRLDWAPDGSSFGACHCLELPLIFDTREAWANAPMLAGPADGARDDVARHMRSTWLSFASHGTPHAEAPWPKYDPHQRRTLVFDSTPTAEEGEQR